MSPNREEDYPAGHPARFDYDPDSPEAKEWARVNMHPKGERDWPVDHPKAADTPGNSNGAHWVAGVDPSKPHLEAFTGRTPEVAARMREVHAAAATVAKETAPLEPIEAPQPPKPDTVLPPAGQPGG